MAFLNFCGFNINRTPSFWCTILCLILLSIMCNAKPINMDYNGPIDAVKNDVQETVDDLIHTGLYSHRTLDSSLAEITRPVKVTKDGGLLSYTVDHSHEHGHARARRDLMEREHELDHSLHYNITVGGRDLRLDLRPSVSFIIPGLIVERHTARGRTRERPDPTATSCHYTGSIRGQNSSIVALSACDGLAGLLRTEHGEYWIEPSKEIPADGTERAHVIFKRSAVNKESALRRSKRAVESRKVNNKYLGEDKRRYTNPKSHHGNYRNIMNPRRKEVLEAKRKRLELMKKRPHEYRRLVNEINEKRKMEARSKSNADSHSLEDSRQRRGRISNSKSVEESRKMKPRKRRRRRAKNCGTKQPKYQWKKKNEIREAELREQHENHRYHKNRPNHLNRRNFDDNARRSVRSISKPRHVEVLLVADKSMTEFHDKGNLEMYLLTIMNLVSSLYMDPTIGNYIKVAVVKIIIIDENDPGSNLTISTSADTTLASFCRWQQKLNPEDDYNPHHHDVAILVTRQDICSVNDTPCSTLGVAHVAGMCKPDRSCSVNEDNGITLAHTITHELGHNFGLYHDTEKIGCHRREGSTLHIMTPIFEADTAQVAWSRCSKRDVTNFLDSGMGECLADTPSKREYEYPSTPAGMIFDAATQCRLQFGAEAAVCAEPAELCEHLWCLVNNTCKTMLRPAAPGTTCGHNMWCENQKCVPRTPSPIPQDGGWGPWSDWNECSRSCGAGVSTQSRECNSPEPSNNGRYCIGERSRYKICNTDPCPVSEPLFRDVQCSKYDNTTYHNETITKWIPYFDQDKPCELVCVPRDRQDVEMLGGFVIDGTPCRQSLGSRDLCIAGVCHHVGCDWIVGSTAEEDACGVCGGDGSNCKTVQGIYTKSTTTQSGFSEVAVIPAGSRNVKIEEKVNPGNYIAIGSAKNKRVYIKGARNETLTEYLVAGSPAIYERDRDWEKVRIPGPITEDIKVYQRIYRGKLRNPGVTYQYTVDRAHIWKLTDWSKCSVTCGRGVMTRRFICENYLGQDVDVSQCSDPPRVPLKQICHQADCSQYTTQYPKEIEQKQEHSRTESQTTTHKPRTSETRLRHMERSRNSDRNGEHSNALMSATHWWYGAWSTCSRSCYMPGQQIWKHRNVYCVDKVKNKVIIDSYCNHLKRPPYKIKCPDLRPC